MDLTRQALQTNGKLYPNFGIIFRIGYNFSIYESKNLSRKY